VSPADEEQLVWRIARGDRTGADRAAGGAVMSKDHVSAELLDQFGAGGAGGFIQSGRLVAMSWQREPRPDQPPTATRKKSVAMPSNRPPSSPQ